MGHAPLFWAHFGRVRGARCGVGVGGETLAWAVLQKAEDRPECCSWVQVFGCLCGLTNTNFALPS